MRLPGQTPNPIACPNNTCVAASNHNQVYGVTNGDAHENWGVDINFSSLWRYEAITAALDSRGRADLPFDADPSDKQQDLTSLMQRPAHGATEHSIVFQPERMLMRLAVADYNSDRWDAPYEDWLTLDIQELLATTTGKQ
jgi:hypothetical protein